MKRSASAVWKGGLQDGKGTVSTESGVLANTPYNFRMRFENEKGTNPEELVAAAHAACFSMALSNILAQGGHPPAEIRTTATLRMSLGEGGPRITSAHLACEGRVPGITAEAFQAAAEKAKDGCPVSKLLKPGLDSLSLAAVLLG